MTEDNSLPDLAWKLWIYTNFDCNLSCSWHPLASPGSDDMLVTSNIFPLSAAVTCIQKNLAAQPDGIEELIEFT